MKDRTLAWVVTIGGILIIILAILNFNSIIKMTSIVSTFLWILCSIVGISFGVLLGKNIKR